MANVLQNSGEFAPEITDRTQNIIIEILGSNITFLEIHFWSENLDFVTAKLFSSNALFTPVYEVCIKSIHSANIELYKLNSVSL